MKLFSYSQLWVTLWASAAGKIISYDFDSFIKVVEACTSLVLDVQFRIRLLFKNENITMFSKK